MNDSTSRRKQQMDLFTRDKVFSLFNHYYDQALEFTNERLLFSLKNMKSNRIKKNEEERTRKNRNIRRRLHSRFFTRFSLFFRSFGCAFVFSLNFTAVDNLFVCSRKTCSVAKFDYIYI